MVPVILKGGWNALVDQCVALPGMIWGHLKADISGLFKR
jgi:hypothetical protein